MHKFLGHKAASTSSVTPLCTDCGGSVVFSSWNTKIPLHAVAKKRKEKKDSSFLLFASDKNDPVVIIDFQLANYGKKKKALNIPRQKEIGGQCF